ncbi:A/G-specific DNA-adenine glycosylase [Mizugakiibacter sediminis]|uniref:Adenine DNA glycosylase n=1 Tax=Mizugakiibacter sediminis TaxID=1475481 RepID=A0A0K8QN83_9GAMM|nr:A/G-specific adenine glycosylase [Mizugakiibacter sediminis]GAP66328.1 A/G-specific DNA-adenine glycosylase [Mizugakiibacter sediminis]
MSTLAARLLDWHDAHGRHDLPWQHPRAPYRVWIAEVMLQQTQVATVIPYFLRFVQTLPTLPDLAAADEDRVLALWSGLGYYRRARFLHRAARICVERHGGELPRDFDALAALPGIGRSTAGAILAQAHGLRFPILDGNVKRVLARYHGERGWPGATAVEKRLWAHAESHTPRARLADYTQAIMDLGATVCTRAQPRCAACPLAGDCVAHRHGLTAELPQARPSKPLPQRAATLLLLRDRDGRVLLERRPPQGVWAGLWSLPQADDADAAARQAGRYARLPGAAQPLPTLVHAFTHFRLHAQPLAWRDVSPLPAIADNARLRWCTRAEAAELGLPAPVRRLLEAIEEYA